VNTALRAWRGHARRTVRLVLISFIVLASLVTGFPTAGPLSGGVQHADAAGGWLTGWNYRRAITIDYTKVSAPLVDFPVLISLTSANFTFSNALGTGYDIRFTSADGTTLLDYERERFVSGSQLADFWVRIPTVSNSANTVFYIYYGKSGAADGSNKTGVWDTSTKGVWHLDEDPSVACFTGKYVCDSTAAAQHGTLNGTMDASDRVTGKIATGLDMDGVDDLIDLGNVSSLNGQAQFTMSMWVKPKSLTEWPVGMAKYSSDTNTFGIQESGASAQGVDDVQVNMSNGAAGVGGTSTGILSANTWGMWTVVFDGTLSGDANRLKFYFNGVQQPLAFYGSVAATTPTSTASLVAGTGPFVMDNMSVANTARSDSWVRASYFTENNALQTYSSQEVANAAPLTPVLGATPAFTNMATPSTTPVLGSFASTDPESDALQYEVQWSTDPTFVSAVTTQSSATGGNGFSAPSYASGAAATYVVQPGEALTNGATYWWRVRSRDASGSNTYSAFSVARSLTVNTALTSTRWFQTTDAQFATGTFNLTTTTGSGSVRLTHANGTVKSKSMDYDWVTGMDGWNAFVFSTTETSGDVKVSLYYTVTTTCDTIVPNGALAGNSTGFDVTASPVNIAGLNTITYNELCLMATLTGSTSGLSLNDWSISAKSNTAPNSPASLSQTSITGTSIGVGGWHNGSVKFSALASDPDTIDSLQLCVEVRPVGTGFTADVQCGTPAAYNGAPVAVTVTISLPGDGPYHWQARVKDDGHPANLASPYAAFGANAESAADFSIDTSAPTTGTVYDGTSVGNDVNYNDGALHTLSANWTAFDATSSGLARYDYSIGTTAGVPDVRGWTSAGSTTSVTATGLTLRTSQAYFVNVRAIDAAGNTSAVVSSDGQFVAPSLSFSLSSHAIDFDALGVGNSFTDVQTLTITTSTNAYNGYKVLVSASGALSSGAATLGGFTGGTADEPDAWMPGDTGFGFTVNDVDVESWNPYQAATCPGGNARTGAGCYAPFSPTPRVVADHPGTVMGTAITAESFTITIKVVGSPSQPAGSYAGSLTITELAEF
jgi:hypothetical protein